MRAETPNEALGEKRHVTLKIADLPPPPPKDESGGIREKIIDAIRPFWTRAVLDRDAIMFTVPEKNEQGVIAAFASINSGLLVSRCAARELIEKDPFYSDDNPIKNE